MAMALYFTGTGNSRYLARRIAEGLDMLLYDLNPRIKARDTAAWRASAIALKKPSSTAKRAKASPGITLKRWKSSRTYEAE